MEEIIEPHLPICDSHHHLWDFAQAFPSLPARYLLPELLHDTNSGHNIESTVFIETAAFYRATGCETMRPLGEVEFANGVAAMAASERYGKTRVCQAIVGWADLTIGAAVEEVLAALAAAATGRFRGVRYSSAKDDSPEIPTSHVRVPTRLLSQGKFREGFAMLDRFKMSFDAWLFHHQLQELSDLAAAFPETPIALDHLGGPLGIGPYAGKRSEVFKAWRKAITDLARHQNVAVKLGGLGMPMFGFGFAERREPASSETLALAWRPYVETCIEAFGASRCMFESNFPADGLSCNYPVLWNAFKRLASSASADEKALLFRDTARRFYRLD